MGRLAHVSLIFLMFFGNAVSGANILFYFATSGYSHRISVWPVIETLARAGHSVTFLSPYPSKDPNQTNPNIIDYVPEGLAQDLGVGTLDFISLRLKEGVSAIDDLWYFYPEIGIRGCEKMMRRQSVKLWINKSSFDLIVINAVFNECAYGLVHKYKAKHIVYSATTHKMWFKDSYGLPDENIPELQFHYARNMTFLQSVKNELNSLYWYRKRITEIFPRVEKILKRELDLTDDLPPLEEIDRNTSLIMTYTDPVEDFPRSLPPNFVHIGGIHCKEKTNPLSDDLEEFVQGGKDGFLILSFGTYVTISNLPKHLQEAFFNVIKRFTNLHFLVKYHGEVPLNFPKNAKAVQWIPQQDVIAHPRIKGFIGHGGLMGLQESVFHAVPMIVIPLFAEQDYNAARVHQRETGITLELQHLTEGKLFHAITEITQNPKYKNNALHLSKLFRDHPLAPKDRAVWWIEYVLRHPDHSHLRPIGSNKSWYERRQLHIWTFLAASALLAFITFFLILKMFIKLLKTLLFNTINKTKVQ